MQSHIKKFQEFINEGQLKDMSYLFSQMIDFKGQPLVQELLTIDQLFLDYRGGNAVKAKKEWDEYTETLFKKNQTFGWDTIKDPKDLEAAIIKANEIFKKYKINQGREEHYMS